MTTLRRESVDGIPVLCEECGTVVTKATEQKAKETVQSHNESRHGGEQVSVAVLDEYEVDVSRPDIQEKFVRQLVEVVR